MPTVATVTVLVAVVLAVAVVIVRVARAVVVSSAMAVEGLLPVVVAVMWPPRAVAKPKPPKSSARPAFDDLFTWGRAGWAVSPAVAVYG